jgi:Probable zinc-ribbon domain
MTHELDKLLSCTTCGDGFIFSAGEQELHQLRGIADPPRQCPRCRRGRPQGTRADK